ncbi:hypothetical protein JW906_08665 [bacterium]|nr:hypothetical protein [bacterium]
MNSISDGNAFRNYENIPDLVCEPEWRLYFSMQPQRHSIHLYYEGSAVRFRDYDDRRYQTHAFGAGHAWTFSEMPAVLAWNFRTGLRRNQPLYAYYDYRYMEGNVDIRLDPDSWWASGAGFYMVGRRYDILSSFDFNEWRLQLRQNFYLPTRTSLIGRFILGREKFMNPAPQADEIESIVAEPSESRPTGGGKGYQKGRNKSQQAGRAAVLFAVAADSLNDSAVDVGIPGREVLQWTASLRAAQALGERTGLAFEGRYRKPLSGEGRTLRYQDSGYEDEDFLFDDPYSYQSREGTIELSRLLPWSVQFKTGFDYADKKYLYAAGLPEGYDGQEQSRRDDRRLFWVVLTKQIFVGKWVRMMRLNLYAARIVNKSNDAYFDYKANVFSLGWGLSL